MHLHQYADADLYSSSDNEYVNLRINMYDVISKFQPVFTARGVSQLTYAMFFNPTFDRVGHACLYCVTERIIREILREDALSLNFMTSTYSVLLRF